MKSSVIGILSASLLAAALALGAQKQDDAGRQLKAAMNTELVDGNLKSAIEQYKKVAQSRNRQVAAQALIHMAGCYQKLGDAEARKVYEQVVKDYADQKDAVAVAQAYLGSKTNAMNGDRSVWTGPKVWPYGRVSPDGRFITARDTATGGLMIHDVATNTDRTLTPPPSSYYSQWTAHSAVSKDGKQVVYEWWDSERTPGRLGLRIASVPASGFVEPRQFFLSNDDIAPGTEGLAGFDWSPDGKWVAASIRRKDRSGQIALIAVADGSLKVLKSTDWNVPERLFFSPDSKYVAYDLPENDTTLRRDVFVMAVDASREIPAVVYNANDLVMGWSPDGTKLLFSSDRTGSIGLWAVPFAGGKLQGPPELLKPDIGPAYSSMGITASGTLYVFKRISNRDVTFAPIDLKAGKLLGPPAGFTQGFVLDPRAASWSPDGKYLAYSVEDGAAIAIRSVATGQVRLLPHSLNYVQYVLWSPDGRWLLTRRGTVAVKDLKGRAGIFKIDVQSGETTAVVVGAVGGGQWSPDGKKIYYTNPASGGTVERDLATGGEREISRERGMVSPDGRYLIALQRDSATNRTDVLVLVSLDNGQRRQLIHLAAGETIGSGGWTQDSSAILFVKTIGTRNELWEVSIAGGPALKLDIDPDMWMSGARAPGSGDFSLSPDGRNIAFQTGTSRDEVWALENFLQKH